MKIMLLIIILFCSSSCNLVSSQQVIDNTNLQYSQTNNAVEMQQKSEEITPNIPKETWVEIFFEEINQVANEVNLKSLRNTTIVNEDIEIRIWIGFGVTKLEGFIIKRTNNNWSSVYLKPNYISKKFIYKTIKLNEPQIGWDKTWQKLLNAEMLSLPDATSIKCNTGVKDGFSYVVEAKKGNKYRTYMYDNPEVNFSDRCKEANQMVKIIKIISTEFKLKEITK